MDARTEFLGALSWKAPKVLELFDDPVEVSNHADRQCPKQWAESVNPRSCFSCFPADYSAKLHTLRSSPSYKYHTSRHDQSRSYFAERATREDSPNKGLLSPVDNRSPWRRPSINSSWNDRERRKRSFGRVARKTFFIRGSSASVCGLGSFLVAWVVYERS